MSTQTAEDFKAMGNAAMQAGQLTQAIEYYTKAINLDGSNHVYYSNRSAAYLQKGDAQNALEDAGACLGLNPDSFPKAYSRKGAALHALKRYNDSIQAYQQGLAKFPKDAGLLQGLEQVQRDKDGPLPRSQASGGSGMPGMFDSNMMARMAMDPKLRPYLSDPDVMSKIKLIQSNPNSIVTVLQDPKMMEFFQLMMGGEEPEETAPASSTTSTARAASSTTADTPKKQEQRESPQPMEVDESEELTPDQRQVQDAKKKALECKQLGNSLYQQKKFDEALKAYDEAVQLDPTNMTFLNNQAAVYFTTKQYEKCIELCLQAVEVGKANRAPFEERAKALTRAAKAQQKLGNISEAINLCQQAQLESFDKDTQRLLKTMELEQKKADAKAYLDDDKAEEAKQRGNVHFRNKDYAEAIREYEEAVKRSPKNAVLRNNLSAALCKIMDFNGAKRQVEEALELDPKYVKAWARKGDIEVLMKENHKAMESYKKGLELEPDNATCRDGLRKVSSMIGKNVSEDERKERAEHAMADPEIQSILQDPVMRQVLTDFNENPQAAQKAMMDATVRSKIEKLIASGIVETR